MNEWNSELKRLVIGSVICLNWLPERRQGDAGASQQELWFQSINHQTTGEK